jgi:hypothetical protein
MHLDEVIAHLDRIAGDDERTRTTPVRPDQFPTYA